MGKIRCRYRFLLNINCMLSFYSKVILLFEENVFYVFFIRLIYWLEMIIGSLNFGFVRIIGYWLVYWF